MASNDDGSSDDENKVFLEKKIVTNIYQRNLTEDNLDILRNGQASPNFNEKAIAEDLNKVYNANSTFLLGSSKDACGLRYKKICDKS
ncbi:hypothetical protein NQ318_006155 [Aromia moschata]|uniref:Uncharacterized protein n=1 Tax=Aromia moschata TaxID=1265417 RepID=A0AAV8XML3_9CUCU|nr:hypothetical protein NQ318_006155 [Aromia moschata]